MAGYRGDGYGAYGDHGDDDYRFGEDRGARGERDRSPGQEPRHGAAHGNLMGRAEERVRDWFEGDDGRPGGERLADDPRAVEAADEWRQRYGREGFEGSYARHEEPYHRFRQRQIDELDRDYQDWCREREQDFHREFDGWRRQRAAASAAGSGEEQRSGGLMAGESSGPAPGLTDADRAEVPAGSVGSASGSGSPPRRGRR